MVALRNEIPIDQITQFCRRRGIDKFALFGSVLREDFRPDSDVDVLFSMLPGHSYGFLEYFDMKSELEKIFGRPVDFIERDVVEESPNWVRRRAILSSAETIYAAG